MHPFRNLLLVATGHADSLEKTPTPETWKVLFNMARYQSLLGILYDGVLRLPENQRPPQELLDKWQELAGLTASIYRRHLQRIEQLEPILERTGLRGCILKGTAFSSLYPKPEHRLYGDIDLWVEGSRRSIIRTFEAEGYTMSDILYQEAKVDLFDDTDVEIHFHPCKMYNPLRNARLQRFFEANAPFKGTLSYAGTRFNAVFCMAHMYRHYLEGGIGLRQMLDYYYVLQDLCPEDRGPVMDALTKLGMQKFTAAVMCSVQFNFGLEDEYLLCPPDKVYGERLVNDIIRMGNFGVLDKRNYSGDGETKWKRFIRKNRRVFSNFKYFPGEVFWSPFARVGQWCWRLLNGYLR